MHSARINTHARLRLFFSAEEQLGRARRESSVSLSNYAGRPQTAGWGRRDYLVWCNWQRRVDRPRVSRDVGCVSRKFTDFINSTPIACDTCHAMQPYTFGKIRVVGIIRATFRSEIIKLYKFVIATLKLRNYDTVRFPATRAVQLWEIRSH